MSQRIEKGGARFKPSIVPRRSNAAASGASPSSAASSHAAGATTPALPAAQRRPSRPNPAASPSPSLHATTPGTVASSPSLRPSQPPLIGGTASATAGAGAGAGSSGGGGKSFAFSQSPARIVVPGRPPSTSPYLTPTTSGQAAGPSHFRRPSLSRPAPGSRTSVTPSRSDHRLRTPSIPPLPSGDLGDALSSQDQSQVTPASNTSSSITSDQPTTKKKPFVISAGSGRSVASSSRDEASNPAARQSEASTADVAALATGTTSQVGGAMLPPTAPAIRSRRESLPATAHTSAPASSSSDSTATQGAGPTVAVSNTSIAARSGDRDGAASGVHQGGADTVSPAVHGQEAGSTAQKRNVPVRGQRAAAQGNGGAASLASASASASGSGSGAAKGKTREDADQTTSFSRSRTRSRGSAPARNAASLDSERAETDNSDDNDDDDDESAEDTESDSVKEARAAKRKASSLKRRQRKREEATGKPRRPPSAYLLFMSSARQQRREELANLPLTQVTSIIADDWRRSSADEKKEWEAQAGERRKEYEAKLAEWTLKYPNGVEAGASDESGWETTSEVDEEGNPVRRRRAQAGKGAGARKKRTVSDDERDYFDQIDAEGPTLAASRIDASSTAMGDLSVPDFKTGRAGPRTFELERVRRRQAEERKVAIQEVQDQIETRKRLGIAGTSAAVPSFQMGNSAGPSSDGPRQMLEGEEEAVSEDNDDDEDDDDDDGEGDATSGAGGGTTSSSRRARRRAPSVAGTEHSFTENRFAVQTRIVDGKIVVDESSLFANYGNGEDFREGMEVVDEREGDRFVNSVSRGKSFGRHKKWTTDDNAKFYWAVRQWGTDFEMISRFFPGRDRVMIKKKWNIEERANPKLIDDALANRLAIDLDAYSQAAGIDFSGPPPEISADLSDLTSLGTDGALSVKKREGTAPESGSRGAGRDGATDDDDDDDDDQWEYEEVVEIDEEGNETVTRKRIGKRGGGSRKKRKTSRKASVVQPPSSEPNMADLTASAAAATSSAGSPSTQPEERTGAGASRPPSIGTSGSAEKKRGRERGHSTSTNGQGNGAPGKRLTRSEQAAATERERKHRAAELRGSEAPNERMEVEEIVGDA